MRVKIAASAEPMVSAGKIKLRHDPVPETGSHPRTNAKHQNQNWSQGEAGKRDTKQTDHAQALILPFRSVPRRRNAGWKRQQNGEQNGWNRKLQRIGIARQDQFCNRSIEAKRLTEIAVQHTVPIANILSAQRDIQAIRVAQCADIGGRRSLPQHLLHRIAGNKVDQKENQRHHDPQYGQHQQQTLSNGSPRRHHAEPFPSWLLPRCVMPRISAST